MNTELDQKNWWDDASCREFEAFLDEMHDEQVEQEYEEMRMAHLEAEWEKERGSLGEF